MQAGNRLRLRTTAATDFAGVLAAGEGVLENLVMADMIGGGGAGLSAGGHCRSVLQELRILSEQNLPWGIELYGTTVGPDTSAIDAIVFLGRWEFQATDGRIDSGDSFYRYWVAGLDLSYQDLDLSGKLHLRLINLDPTVQKEAAGDGGDIVIELALEPTQGI